MRAFLIYGSYRLLGALIGPLPPRIGYWLARRAGALFYFFALQQRRILSHNTRHVLGPGADEEQVQALVRQVCVNLVKCHYELFRLARLTADEIEEVTQIEGQEHLEWALAQGKGVIAITAHFGNWDVVGQLPLIYGVPLTGPIQRIQPERLFQYTLKMRRSHGVKLIPADEPLMELFRALKRGEIIGLPCDRSIADNTSEVNFFGSPTQLSDGSVRVALRTGAPLIPVFSLRLPDDTFLVQIEPPLELPRSGDREADVAAGMEMVVDVMERYISRYPEQWLVAVPVWPMD